MSPPSFSPTTAMPASSSIPVVNQPQSQRPYDRVKRGVDIVVAGLLLALTAPVLAFAWVLVRLTSAGPGFYSQSRIGRFGEPFEILKLRTMFHRCEAQSGAVWAKLNDPRITPVGHVLRKLHVDELPQLLNILRGDMSLVGPRPERPEFVCVLSEVIPGYADRLRVRPGLTGLAQIQLPPDTDFESVRRKIVLDRLYLERRGLGFDLRLLAGTAIYLCGLSYAGVRRVVRLPNPLANLADPMADTVIESSVR